MRSLATPHRPASKKAARLFFNQKRRLGYAHGTLGKEQHEPEKTEKREQLPADGEVFKGEPPLLCDGAPLFGAFDRLQLADPPGHQRHRRLGAGDRGLHPPGRPPGVYLPGLAAGKPRPDASFSGRRDHHRLPHWRPRQLRHPHRHGEGLGRVCQRAAGRPLLPHPAAPLLLACGTQHRRDHPALYLRRRGYPQLLYQPASGGHSHRLHDRLLYGYHVLDGLADRPDFGRLHPGCPPLLRHLLLQDQ